MIHLSIRPVLQFGITYTVAISLFDNHLVFEDSEQGNQQMDEALKRFDDLSDYKVSQNNKQIYHA